MTPFRSNRHSSKPFRIILACTLLSFGSVSLSAKSDDDDDDAGSAAAAARFPQPVVVGTLIGRTVLEPLESQPKLGRVSRILRGKDGAIVAIVDYGGFFGLGARPIAVPIGAMALLGADMEIVGFKPEQLDGFPTFQDGSDTAPSNDEIIRVGLAKPTH